MARKEPADPVLTAVESYRSGMAAFNARPDWESNQAQAIAETYGPQLAKIHALKEPATTRAGAMAALALAKSEADEGADLEIISSMLGAALGYFQDERTASPLVQAFAAAVAGRDRHVQMEGLYDALAHISDTVSAVACRPRFDDDQPSTEAFSALDDFVMEQMDAVKAKALATKPTDWPSQEARASLLLKHVARFRTDIAEVLEILDQISADNSIDQSAT